MPVKHYDCRTTEKTVKAYTDREGKLRHKIQIKTDCGALNITQEADDKEEDQKGERMDQEEEVSLEEIREMFRRFIK